MTPRTVPALLRKAHAVIERVGWTQGQFTAYRDWRHSPVCLFGALCVALDVDPNDPFGLTADGTCNLIGKASDAIQAVLRRRGFRYSLSTWNDTIGRTRDEVLDLVSDAQREATPWR